MEYHSVVGKILEFLNEKNCIFQTFEHGVVRTSEDAARARPEYSLKQGAKAMIVKVKMSLANKRFVMLVLPGNLKFDNKKVKAILGAKDIQFATEAEVGAVTGGVLPGGVPPFGNLFGIDVIVDPKLFENEIIIFNAGDRRFSVSMKSSDYRRAVNLKVVEIT